MIVLSGLIKNTKGKKILSVTFCGSPQNVFLQFKRGQNEKGVSLTNQTQCIRKPEDLRSL